MEEDKETENDGMVLYHGSSAGLMSCYRCNVGAPGGKITCLHSNKQKIEELVFKIQVFPTPESLLSSLCFEMPYQNR